MSDMDYCKIAVAIVALAEEVCVKTRADGKSPCVYCLNQVILLMSMRDEIVHEHSGSGSLVGNPTPLLKGFMAALRTEPVTQRRSDEEIYGMTIVRTPGGGPTVQFPSEVLS